LRIRVHRIGSRADARLSLPIKPLTFFTEHRRRRRTLIGGTSRLRFASFALACCLSGAVAAEDNSAAADQTALTADAIKTAVAKSLPLLEKGARGSMEKRKQCFTCHNQALPVLALTTAHTRGFAIDWEHLQEQIKFTAAFLEKNRTFYLEGRGQGGAADTAGYALWTLENGGWKPDATTAAVTEYLLLFQKELDHWKPSSRRPPTEQSLFTSTHVALRGLKAFGTPDQQNRIKQRTAQVGAWLLRTPPEDTEDRVSRLRALHIAGAGASTDEIERSVKELSQLQREDGGWSQLPQMESDPYATGSVLVALHQAGGVATSDPLYAKGLRYLVSSQLEDGSWHVKTRSEPIQTYYESGYPHGQDQFISIAAAGWATTALALALPETPPAAGATAPVQQPSSAGQR
jgi:N-acyl-D-amino-acid deacylase